MSNDYVTTLLVNQRVSELHEEAAQARLARAARAGQPRRRWWDRLVLAHPRSTARVGRSAAGTAAVSDAPC